MRKLWIVASAASVCVRMVSLGTSHSASGGAPLAGPIDGHSRAMRPTACAASSV